MFVHMLINVIYLTIMVALFAIGTMSFESSFSMFKRPRHRQKVYPMHIKIAVAITCVAAGILSFTGALYILASMLINVR